MKKNKQTNKKEKQFKTANFYMCEECGFIGLKPFADYSTDFRILITPEEYKHLKEEWRKILKFQKYIRKLYKLRGIKKEQKPEYENPEIQKIFELFKEVMERGGGIITANPELWEEK